MHGDPPVRQGGGQPVGEAGGAPRQRPERRLRGGIGPLRRAGAPAHGPTHPSHQAARLVGGGQEERKGGGGTELVDSAGVDAPDERVDEPVDHGLTEALADDLAHRAVAEAHPRPQVGAEQVPGHPGRLGRGEDPRSEQWEPAGRHPEVQPGGHHAQSPPGPDRGTAAPHGHHVPFQSELGAQVGGLRAPSQKGVGGQVDTAPGELGGPHLAADPVRRLEEMDLQRSTGGRAGADHQLPGGGQTGDTAAHDRHDRRGRGAHAGCMSTGSVGGVHPTAVRTTPARRPRKCGSSLSDGVRAKAIPRESATCRASMSRS